MTWKTWYFGLLTMAQQEIQNAVTPVQQQYTTLGKNAAIDQTQAEQTLQNSIANLVPQETSDTRAIQNAIAQLEGGAVTQGAQLGSNLYGTSYRILLQMLPLHRINNWQTHKPPQHRLNRP